MVDREAKAVRNSVNVVVENCILIFVLVCLIFGFVFVVFAFLKFRFLFCEKEE